jgi:hypothetical protein
MQKQINNGMFGFQAQGLAYPAPPEVHSEAEKIDGTQIGSLQLCS